MTSLSQNADTVSYPNENVYSIRAQILTRITRMILVLGKSALSVPDTRFSRVSGSTLVCSVFYGGPYSEPGRVAYNASVLKDCFYKVEQFQQVWCF